MEVPLGIEPAQRAEDAEVSLLRRVPGEIAAAQQAPGDRYDAALCGRHDPVESLCISLARPCDEGLQGARHRTGRIHQCGVEENRGHGFSVSILPCTGRRPGMLTPWA